MAGPNHLCVWAWPIHKRTYSVLCTGGLFTQPPSLRDRPIRIQLAFYDWTSITQEHCQSRSSSGTIYMRSSRFIQFLSMACALHPRSRQCKWSSNQIKYTSCRRGECTSSKLRETVKGPNAQAETYIQVRRFSPGNLLISNARSSPSLTLQRVSCSFLSSSKSQRRCHRLMHPRARHCRHLGCRLMS